LSCDTQKHVGRTSTELFIPDKVAVLRTTNASKMVMTKSQTNRAIDDGTTGQVTMTSIEETKIEHAPTETEIIEKYMKLSEDGKRRRTPADLKESPNGRSPKWLKQDGESKDNTNNLHLTESDETSEEENHDKENKEEDEHRLAYHEAKGWSFTWTEMTHYWTDLPQAVKDKAQPFLLEDMQGTTRNSPSGLVKDLLNKMKLDDTNLAGQI
jgi:hypothetical protein